MKSTILKMKEKGGGIGIHAMTISKKILMVKDAGGLLWNQITVEMCIELAKATYYIIPYDDINDMGND